jgi:hypothetical protein
VAARDAVPISRGGVRAGHARDANPVQDVIVTGNTASTQTRTWIISALLVLFVFATLLWVMRSCSIVPVAPDGPGDLAAEIAEVQARNKALEAEIARRKSSAPTVKCVPEPVPPAPKAARERSPSAMKEAVAAARHT